MFERLKRLLAGEGQTNPGDAASSAQHSAKTSFSALGSTAFGGLAEDGAQSSAGASLDPGALERWAMSIGAAYSVRSNGMPALSGAIQGKPWRMEVGRSSRDYIRGDEIRMRGELDVSEDAVVLVMTRRLKEKLEKAAYSIYTDHLRTTLDPNLPEEMRWLSVYEEFGWPEIGMEFFDEFSVLADSRTRAMDFMSDELAQYFRAFNRTDVDGQQLPLVVIVMRGKAYLRTLHEPADIDTLAASFSLFEAVCIRSLNVLTTDVPL